MISRKQSAALAVAVVIAVGALTMFFLSLSQGRTAAASPLKGKVLRRKDDLKRSPDDKERNALRSQNPDKDEKRKLTTHEFKDMPLKIQAIRNVDSDTWYKDLQIEVKNIGAKPIYGILAYLEFPDHKPGGRDIGMTLSYGELKYWDIEVLADPQDIHLDPGQTYVFTIPAKDARVLQKKHERAPQEFKKLDFHMDVIDFGDGTGFQATTPIDVRKTKQPDAVQSKRHHGENISVRSPPQDACGSCGRYFVRLLLPVLTSTLVSGAPALSKTQIRPYLVGSTAQFIGIATRMVLMNVPKM